MSSINSVTLMGNLGNDPELRFLTNGTAVCTFRMATNEYYTDKEGKGQTRCEWHKIVVWGKAAEACGKNLKKGRLVAVQGRLQTRSWKDKNGTTHYTTEVVSARTQFLPSGGQKVEPLQVAEETSAPVEEEAPAEDKTVPMNVREMFEQP
jgi:single-strand DNA-binding protein